MTRLPFAVVVVAGAIVSLALAGPAGAETVGRAQVVDGETLIIQGQAFCLAGIDAPEPGQTCINRSGKRFDCGQVAGTALMDLTAGVDVRCRPTGAKRQQCAMALCTAGDYDLSEGMVYTGWALPDPATGGQYLRYQALAEKRGHGMWRGSFESPWEWRAKQAAKNN